MDITSYLLGKKKGGGGGSSELDWSILGFSTPPADYNYILDGYDYATGIYNNWTPQENLQSKFLNDTNLIYMPSVDTSVATTMRSMFFGCSNLASVAPLDSSNAESMRTMFNGCSNLVEIPFLNASKVTEFTNMFLNCGKLNNTSLDNILKMCISATSYRGTKTLLALDIAKTYYPASTIQALPSYQDFIDAGWTIGY